MNKFGWYEATTIEDALKQADATVSAALTSVPGQVSVLKAGGIDLLDLMKEGLIAPKRIVNIRNIPCLDKIAFNSKDGLKIGANVTLGEMEEAAEIKDNYLALYQAITHAGTPQLRNMASLGGNLAQRTRCWYFRSIEHRCFRKGGNMCFAKNSENEFHAIMKNGMCCSVHASSISTALIAFDASVEIASADGKKRLVALEEFFVLPGDDPLRENILKANEMITAVTLPPLVKNAKSFYLKQGGRESYDWALADVAVHVEVSGSSCKNARIALGAAAPVPIRSREAEALINGKPLNEDSAKAAALAAMQGTTPLAKNGYKIPLFKAILKRALLELA